MLEPPAPNGGLLDAGLGADSVEEVVEDRRRIGVRRVAFDRDDVVVVDRDLERAPVGQVRQRSAHGAPPCSKRSTLKRRSAHRPGARVLTSWINQPLPSGSLNDANVP